VEDKWWGRVGVIIGLLSAFSYLVGVIVVAEFTRPMGLGPSDLGLGVREYTIIAGLALFLTLVVCVVIGVSNFMLWAVVEKPKAKASVAPRSWGAARRLGIVASVVGLFGASALAVAPIVGLFGGPEVLGVGQAAVIYVILGSVGIVIGAVLSEMLKETRREVPVIGSHRPAELRLYVMTIRSFSGDPRRVVAFVLSVLVVVAGVSSYSASRYANVLLADDTPTTPFLLRYVVNPSNMCARWSNSHLVPSNNEEDDVVRVSRGPSGEVVILNGRTWLVDPGEVLLASSC
jgi:hypothetical protein